MITGMVTPEREAIIALMVRDGTTARSVQAAIDTGFNDFLTLPRSLIDSFGFPFVATGQAMLADGRTVPVDYYRGTVVWDGRTRLVPIVDADGEPLVGMAMPEGYELTIQVVDNGAVTIRALGDE